jgi:hypothetical protein
MTFNPVFLFSSNKTLRRKIKALITEHNSHFKDNEVLLGDEGMVSKRPLEMAKSRTWNQDSVWKPKCLSSFYGCQAIGKAKAVVVI